VPIYSQTTAVSVTRQSATLHSCFRSAQNIKHGRQWLLCLQSYSWSV